jgi:hypothetical protein
MKRFLLFFVLLVLASCGGKGSSVSLPAPGAPSGGGTIGAAATVTVTASPSTITVLGTTAVTATVKDGDGNDVPDGTIVRFTLNPTGIGSITSQANTVHGQAVVTFTASSTPGAVTVTATSGTVSNTATITIQAAATGSIEFVSASPQVIGLAGTGQTTISTITFLVKDVNGNPVSGKSVSFSMNGPGGGEYLQPTSQSTNAAGKAVTLLNSGNVSGPVTVTAQVTVDGGTVLSTSSSVISIGGGLPSATHFNLATTVFNLPGLNVSNAQATISSYIADRFGNFNILSGTSVSYYAEAGAINRSSLTDATGLATTLFRTQAPVPVNVTPMTWENNLCTYLSTTYGFSCSAGHPRDGWATILSTVQGEEAFLDENGNGAFDLSYSTSACPAGYSCECDTGTTGIYSSTIKPADGVRTCPNMRSEAFTDLGEPFIDKNDDGCRNDGTNGYCPDGTTPASTDPFEEFVDANGNGSYDGPNGFWDGPGCNPQDDPNNLCQQSKMISTSIPLGITGNAAHCAVSDGSGSITSFGPLGSSEVKNFTFVVGDVNFNSLMPGTTITVTSTVGTLTGETSKTLLDAVPVGPTEISFAVSNGACTTCGSSTQGTLTVKVTPPSGSLISGCTVTVSGSVLKD